ncbi:hypothetical protein EV356DRAFT_514879 [Viridothelium virens]|uniref:Cytochrome c oxidase assembly protein COX20, mitochondrial n=1 Tax=Viridothelium virens TaxID=1048519 RepID=A0A6A6HA99_VIRVR|nr:hypothetical protein EV356DRAFT_514879 [Viridothelium virens]
MADDTREASMATPIGTKSHDQDAGEAGKGTKDIGPIRRPQSANVMPGGTQNTAGGQVKPVSAVDAAKTIKLEDFREIHKKPCVRDTFLTSIPSSLAIGAVWAVLGAPVKKATNWAAGAFCAISFFSYEYCQFRRGMEKDGMRRAVQVMDEKRADREAKMKAAREERRKAKEEADRQEEERKKSWRPWNGWKFW